MKTKTNARKRTRTNARNWILVPLSQERKNSVGYQAYYRKDYALHHAQKYPLALITHRTNPEICHVVKYGKLDRMWAERFYLLLIRCLKGCIQPLSRRRSS